MMNTRRDKHNARKKRGMMSNEKVRADNNTGSRIKCKMCGTKVRTCTTVEGLCLNCAARTFGEWIL